MLRELVFGTDHLQKGRGEEIEVSEDCKADPVKYFGLPEKADNGKHPGYGNSMPVSYFGLPEQD